MPGAAAGLADVGAGDRHPAVLLGRRDQRPQALPVRRLDLGPGGEIETGARDPLGEIVAHGLETSEVERPRRVAAGGDTAVELDPAEALREEGR